MTRGLATDTGTERIDMDKMDSKAKAACDFKVGDRVTIASLDGSYDAQVRVGDAGVVTRTYEGYVLVRTDVWRGSVENVNSFREDGWYFAPWALRLVGDSALPGAGPGAKDDSSKARYDLIPTALLDGVADVLKYGASEAPRPDGTKGYGENNWQNVPNARARYYAAAGRHLAKWKKDPTSKDESGRSHLAHAATCIAFLLSFEMGHDPVL